MSLYMYFQDACFRCTTLACSPYLVDSRPKSDAQPALAQYWVHAVPSDGVSSLGAPPMVAMASSCTVLGKDGDRAGNHQMVTEFRRTDRRSNFVVGKEAYCLSRVEIPQGRRCAWHTLHDC